MTFDDLGLGVKFWWTKDDGVEASRPSHCAACGLSAHRGDGGLRLHGHGRRERTVWGPTRPESSAAETTVWMRRYLCTSCNAVRTAPQPGLAPRLRYAAAAVALALTVWAVWLWPAAEVRARVSPWRIVGLSEADRWRSLRRWARRSALFGLPAPARAESPRALAARIAQLVRARGPTDAPEAARVVLGAHVR